MMRRLLLSDGDTSVEGSTLLILLQPSSNSFTTLLYKLQAR